MTSLEGEAGVLHPLLAKLPKLDSLDLSELQAAAERLEPNLTFARTVTPHSDPRTTSPEALTYGMLARKDGVEPENVIREIPPDAAAELRRFWLEHPSLRAGCEREYGYDPLEEWDDYWPYGLAEEPHAATQEAVRENGGVFTLPLVQRWEVEELAHTVNKADTAAAGIAVRAADTGRVLMIQRSNHDPTDPAAGTWEFPGGKLSDGEHPHRGAQREWQEETGLRLPKGRHAGEWRSGVYHGFVHEIPKEASVKLNLDQEDRRVLNPDDPDGDQLETMAWVHPDHLRHWRALRQELRASKVWNKVEKADPTVYLIRHGKTALNHANPRQDRIRGWIDVPLNATGERQARTLARSVKDAGIDCVYTSDLKRCVQTADTVGRAIGVNPIIAPEFRPWGLGDFEGQPSATVIPEIEPYVVDNPGTPVPGGESFLEFRDRVIPAFERALTLAEEGYTPAIVTSYRPIKLLDGWLAGGRRSVDLGVFMSDDLPPASVIVCSKRNGQWTYSQEDPTGGVGKENAPGPAGDIPPAGDMGTNQVWPDSITRLAVGPAADSVHVNRPLPNVSVGYMQDRIRGPKRVLRGEFLPITKEGAMKQLVYGVVLEPNSFDSQDDFMLPHHVEKAAHGYLKKAIRGKSTVAKLQHRLPGFKRDKPSIVPVESFVAPVDFTYDGVETIKKGSWVMCMHVEDTDLWQDFLDGKYQAFSVGGSGVRQALTRPFDLEEHDLIGRQQPNYFEPNPRNFLSPGSG